MTDLHLDHATSDQLNKLESLKGQLIMGQIRLNQGMRMSRQPDLNNLSLTGVSHELTARHHRNKTIDTVFKIPTPKIYKTNKLIDHIS